ncbi:unnamed protein product [Mycena citricolor]|uniref:Uncharacterized protein n=1 Tax=Mycena citricolor TaxID=2018698 RepID=A0AAD2Q737_9AGAR|nr:unnamed protein product [Mycena citricolor]
MFGIQQEPEDKRSESPREAIQEDEAIRHVAYAEQTRLDGYAKRVKYALSRKAAFDKKVLKSRAGNVVFKEGELVQVFRSDLAETVSNDRKLTCRWTEPHRVKARTRNSYTLESVEGIPLDGHYNARRLRHYKPRDSTPLAKAQDEYKKRRGEQEDDKSIEQTEDTGKQRDKETAEVERWRIQEAERELRARRSNEDVAI